jgi:FkbM family methyltransferase
MWNFTTMMKTKWKTLQTYLDIFGLSGSLHAFYCVFSKRKIPVAVHHRWSRHPLHIRVNSSDVSVFRQVFIDREYDIASAALSQGGIVIDGGANIGLTSVFLADRHPGIRIYAIEPDAANFQMLQINTSAYPNVSCLHGALWNRDGAVRIAHPGDKEWAFRVEEATMPRDADIPAIRLSTLFDRIEVQRVALLKLDIEGAEKEVLEDAEAWIGVVDNIVIELHENLRPGCTALFSQVTSALDIVAKGRELTLASRRSA